MSVSTIVTYGLSAEDADAVAQAAGNYDRQVVHAADAQSARASIAAEVPPIVFVHAAAGGDGYALCSEWKTAHPDAAVVLVAPDDEIDTKLEAVTAGADQFLIAPIDDEALEFVLRFFLVEKAL